ncbi:hypothetical protein BpHYR1_010869 [Brachionus plicatilis]|uniref:Uncharacterized protein n=1 Tax=Brachionus plicatilis TaxID=10195 RepID=A0A3M7RVI0_BRAPC|nr:hypothetical protein BpHYR1_010869 [Brachionus plicatilis]
MANMISFTITLLLQKWKNDLQIFLFKIRLILPLEKNYIYQGNLKLNIKYKFKIDIKIKQIITKNFVLKFTFDHELQFAIYQH